MYSSGRLPVTWRHLAARHQFCSGPMAVEKDGEMGVLVSSCSLLSFFLIKKLKKLTSLEHLRHFAI